MKKLNIIYEDKELLVVDKESHQLTIATEKSLLQLIFLSFIPITNTFGVKTGIRFSPFIVWHGINLIFPLIVSGIPSILLLLKYSISSYVNSGENAFNSPTKTVLPVKPSVRLLPESTKPEISTVVSLNPIFTL